MAKVRNYVRRHTCRAVMVRGKKIDIFGAMMVFLECFLNYFIEYQMDTKAINYYTYLVLVRHFFFTINTFCRFLVGCEFDFDFELLIIYRKIWWSSNGKRSERANREWVTVIEIFKSKSNVREMRLLIWIQLYGNPLQIQNDWAFNRILPLMLLS